MPEINLELLKGVDFKAIRAEKRKRINEQKNKIKDKIVITPFEININKRDVPITSIIASNVRVTRECYDRTKYVNCSTALMLLLPNMKKPTVRLLSYIVYNLKYNANVIKFTYDDLKRNMYEFGDNSNQKEYIHNFIRETSNGPVIEDEFVVANSNIVINSAIDELCNYGVICRTDIVGTYIVNHNYLFRGNYDDFINVYMDEYGFIDQNTLWDDKKKRMQIKKLLMIKL